MRGSWTPIRLCPAGVIRGGVWRGVQEQCGQCQVHKPGSEGCLWLSFCCFCSSSFLINKTEIIELTYLPVH